MLVTGLIVAYGYAMESSSAGISGNEYEWYMTKNRMFGPYWLELLGADLLQRARSRSCSGSGRCGMNPIAALVITIVVNIGMWLERYVIVITSLHRDFLPSVLGHVLPDDLGLDDVHRHDRLFFLFASCCSSACCRRFRSSKCANWCTMNRGTRPGTSRRAWRSAMSNADSK